MDPQLHVSVICPVAPGADGGGAGPVHEPTWAGHHLARDQHKL